MFLRPFARPGWTAALVLFTLTFAGCFQPAPFPSRTFFEYSPNCFCTGDVVTVTRNTLGVNDIVRWTELLKSDGTVLVRFSDTALSAQTPPMQADWLPLSYRFEAMFEGEREIEIPDEDQPVNIDAPTWLTYDSTEEIPTSAGVELVQVGEVEEFDTATGTRITVNLYDVYLDFDGFVWSLPMSDFGTRAGLLAIRNESDLTMTFRVAGVEGEQQLAPGAEWAMPPPLHPALDVSARYSPPARRLIGRQKGERTKPENEHFEYTDVYVPEVAELGIRVSCRQEE